jgi:hypothetical protein
MDELLGVRDFYWAHRDLFRAGAAITTIALINGALLFWVARQLQHITLIRDRVSRLTDGLALLTDTTEAGLSTLIKEVEQLGGRRKPSKGSSRASVSKRVAAAADKGEKVAEIATTEGLSESEVRLHLSLAKSLNADGAATPGTTEAPAA